MVVAVNTDLTPEDNYWPKLRRRNSCPCFLKSIYVNSKTCAVKFGIIGLNSGGGVAGTLVLSEPVAARYDSAFMTYVETSFSSI